MVELPKLSESVSRLHVLRWDDLLQKHGFNGDHFKWHESRDRRRRVAKPAFSLAPPPPPILRSGSSSGRVTFCGSQGEPLTYEQWRRREMAAWAARENDPSIIDSIGIEETIMLAEARFVGVVEDYFLVWAGANGDSDEFRGWLESIGVLVGCEISDVWGKKEWHAAWFKRACRRKVEEALIPLMAQWKSRASGLEILHLENPRLSLKSLLAAGGEVNLVVKFERSAHIDAARCVRDFDRSGSSLEAGGSEATTSGNGAQPAAVDESASLYAPTPAVRIPQLAHAPKHAKRTARYSAIDKMLISIAEAKPKNHEEVFRSLEERKVRIPPAEPFASAGGWTPGFRNDRQAARAWLSKRWSLLKLPSFQRGPKQ